VFKGLKTSALKLKL